MSDEIEKIRQRHDSYDREVVLPIPTKLRQAHTDRGVLLGKLESEMTTWRDVALRAGEMMAANGPDGYYTFTPQQWLDWVTSVQKPTP